MLVAHEEEQFPAYLKQFSNITLLVATDTSNDVMCLPECNDTDVVCN